LMLLLLLFHSWLLEMSVCVQLKGVFWVSAWFADFIQPS
jgi:hypothetical protein